MWLIFWQVQLCHFYLMVITSSHKNSSPFSSLAFSPQFDYGADLYSWHSHRCLMSFRKDQLSFCPQKQSKHCLKLITTRFSCPINSHFNSMICGCSFNFQALEMTSLSGNSRWWKMAYIRERCEHNKSSAVSHCHCDVLTSISRFRPMMRLNLQGKKTHSAEDVCIIKLKHLCNSEDYSCAEANKTLKVKRFQPHHKYKDP